MHRGISDEYARLREISRPIASKLPRRVASILGVRDCSCTGSSANCALWPVIRGDLAHDNRRMKPAIPGGTAMLAGARGRVVARLRPMARIRCHRVETLHHRDSSCPRPSLNVGRGEAIRGRYCAPRQGPATTRPRSGSSRRRWPTRARCLGRTDQAGRSTRTAWRASTQKRTLSVRLNRFRRAAEQVGNAVLAQSTSDAVLQWPGRVTGITPRRKVATLAASKATVAVTIGGHIRRRPGRT